MYLINTSKFIGLKSMENPIQSFILYASGKNVEYLESTTETLVFDSLIC